jgi:hypothetical protein
MGKIHDLARINSSSVTAEVVKAMGFSQDGWSTFAQSIGLDHDTIVGIYGDHTARAEQVGAEMAERAAEAEAEAESEAEAKAESGEISDAALDQVIADIRQSPAYWDEKAPQQEHDRAVNALNKAMAMRQGLIPRTLEAAGEYAREFKAEQDQKLKEQYGVQGGSLFKTGDFSSSNGRPAVEDVGGKDDFAQQQLGDADGESEGAE